FVHSLIVATVAAILATSVSQAADVIRVAYAGSMGVVMDRFIGPAFAKATNVEFQGIGQGSYALARQLEARLLQADVFVPITAAPIQHSETDRYDRPGYPSGKHPDGGGL